jgi:hypothetical protein
MKLISKLIVLCLFVSASVYGGLRFIHQAPAKSVSNDNNKS